MDFGQKQFILLLGNLFWILVSFFVFRIFGFPVINNTSNLDSGIILITTFFIALLYVISKIQNKGIRTNDRISVLLLCSTFVGLGILYLSSVGFFNSIIDTTSQVWVHIAFFISTLSIFNGLLAFSLGDKVIFRDTSKVSEVTKTLNTINTKPQVNWYVFLLLTLITGGLVLRINGISHLSVWIDEANSLIVGERIAQGFGPTLLSGSYYPRAIVYHEYLGALIRIFSNPEITGRLANILFFIITAITLYFFGKKIHSKLTGLLTVFLYVCSWVSIAMFREIRFYEMLLMCVTFLYFLIYQILLSAVTLFATPDRALRKTKLFLAENIYYIILTLFIAGLSYDTQTESSLILFPLILIGFFLFLSNSRSKVMGMLITASSLFLLILGGLYVYKENFKLEYLVLAPQPGWKDSLGSLNFFDFMSYIVTNDYWYLLPITSLSLWLLVRKRDFFLVFSSAFLLALYSIISIQGYGSSAIRYYYILFPIIFLLSAYLINVTWEYLSKKDNRAQLVTFCIVTMLILLTSVFSAVKESNSAYTFTSKNETRNINYDAAFSFLAQQDLSRSTVIVDDQLSMPYYVYFHKAANYYLITGTNSFNRNSRNYYTNIYPVGYDDPIMQSGKRLFVLFIKRKYYYLPDNYTLIDPNIISFFNSHGELLYNTDSISIYRLNG